MCTGDEAEVCSDLALWCFDFVTGEASEAMGVAAAVAAVLEEFVEALSSVFVESRSADVEDS